jgi:malonyl-CoA O-methyltransferase
MAQRLEWIRSQPQAWVHWQPTRGGLQAQPLLVGRYPRAACTVVEPGAASRALARQQLQPPWWRRWSAAPVTFAADAPEGQAQMLWANMALHATPDPVDLIGRWHRALATDGFVMFSCLGPDSLRELRTLYAREGWPPPGPDFTDMHDWGDLLVQAGFAEPVMDMERLTLTWGSPDTLLAELRELGMNLHPGRFAACRGRRWRDRLQAVLQDALAGPDGRLALTFEIVYGHAVKPTPRPRLAGESRVTLQDMRQILHAGR